VGGRPERSSVLSAFRPQPSGDRRRRGALRPEPDVGALGEDAAALIATVPGKGYCLTAPSEAPLAPPLAPLPVPPSGRPMVVVQPFESLAEDRGEDYFAAGLTADLVTDLARFEALQVVAPRNRDWAAEAALPNGPRGGSAKRYLVGGSVRRAGGRIRVTARLEDLATGVHLWADRFDRPLDDLFAVQEELADRIAARLVSQLDQEGMRQARQRPPASLDAYDLCLRGRELHGRVTEAATLEARAMFDRAIALDPDYGLAHSWQAFTVHRGYTHWWGEPHGFAAVPLALALAERGVALAPESPFCVSTLGYVQYLAGA
jgi:TolB-like protein